AGAATLAKRAAPPLAVGRHLAVSGDGTTSTMPASRWRRWSTTTSPLLAPLLAPMGWLVYQAYLWRRTGDLTFWYQVEKRFFNGGVHPWAVTGHLSHTAIQQPRLPSLMI